MFKANSMTLARHLAMNAAASCPAEAARLPEAANDQNHHASMIEAEKRNTAKLRAAAFAAQQDERQIGMF